MSTPLEALLGATVSLAVLLCLAGSAAAQTYTVTRTDDPNPAPCEPTNCSLRQALEAANATTAVDDVVVVPASTEAYLLEYEELALPIADEVEVRGAGADKTVVRGDGKESIFFVGPFEATLTGLTITGGTSAIQNNGELLVRGVSIEGNKWTGGTAGIITNGLLSVESSFLGRNRTESSTGGVIHANAAVTIVNSTVAQNFSKAGPGAVSGNAAVTIVNSAVVSNRSETLTSPAVGGSPLTVRNSVFSDNRNEAGVLSCFSFMPIASLGGNVSDDASCGASSTDRSIVIPSLGTLELHGGTTPVYDLLAGSPAIDATSDCPPVDQRGIARPQGAACDSGPYELQPPPASRAPTGGDSEFSMKVGKKLRLTRKRAIRVKLTCPRSEVSPSCRGKVRLGSLPLIFDGPHTLEMRFLSARFSIAAGRTRTISVKSPRSTRVHLPTTRGSWRVLLLVQARDAAGNEWVLRKKRALLIRR
ncbi:MAG TPA: right-handed parallel beta-helix repeat-containing protein [Solirubrobacterales bacterium]|nr:right-handed parallel beta-helix repeat-containing protein [Solirubrobacterales bacterium]